MNVHDRELEEDESNFEQPKQTTEIKHYEKTEEQKKQLNENTALKFDNGKNRFDLIPPYALWEIARIYTYGAQKYEDNNWLRSGMKWGRFFSAIMRHLWKWWGGEKLDKESGLPHLAHAAWGCLALLQYEKEKLGVDDRVKGSNIDE